MSVVKHWIVDDDPGRFNPQSRYWTESEDAANMARDAGATVVEYVPAAQLAGAVEENERLREAAQHAVDVAREFGSGLRLPEWAQQLDDALGGSRPSTPPK